MPTYEYQCKSCDHRFEVAQKMSAEPLTVCPECNGTLRRVLFPAGIVFKGSGFYKTDHGSGAVVNNNNHDPSEPKENKEGTAHKEGSSEKPAASSEKPAASGDKAAATVD
ncbi:MAG TPA: FmdB family zinc ribbon protein [Ktedonobacteraceae bacterium]